jgi:hypothetical protein
MKERDYFEDPGIDGREYYNLFERECKAVERIYMIQDESYWYAM